MFKIAIVVCLLSAVCALPAPEAGAEAYNTPYQAYYAPYQGYQGYNFVQPGYNNQGGYNQLAYTQEDAKTSLEQDQMGDQLKDMLRSLYSTFIDLKLEDTAKQSAQSAMLAFNQGRFKRSAEAYNTPYQAYYAPYQGYQGYNFVQPAFNNQRGYNQLAYTTTDAKTSLEQEQMGDQLKDMLRSLYSTFIDLKLE